MTSADTHWGIYIHLPWCRVQCPYCAFYVIQDRQTPSYQPLITAIVDEFARRRADYPAHPPTTLYLGGGTPSRLPADAIAELCSLVEATEITVEANPEDLTLEWMSQVSHAGCNRFSVGIQSFQPEQLGLLGRKHLREDAQRAFPLLAKCNWSMDLIFGVPGQTIASLQRDLTQLIALDPDHVSLYSLGFEPGTRLTRARDEGHLKEIDEELWVEMFQCVEQTLTQAGYQRYEISNFSKSIATRSTHNQLYWNHAPVMALGPSASGLCCDGSRYTNIADLKRYLAGEPAFVEPYAAERLAHELVITKLRTTDGLCPAELAQRTGHELQRADLSPMVKSGHLIWSVSPDQSPRLMLTASGRLIADTISVRIAQALRPT